MTNIPSFYLSNQPFFKSILWFVLTRSKINCSIFLLKARIRREERWNSTFRLGIFFTHKLVRLGVVISRSHSQLILHVHPKPIRAASKELEFICLSCRLYGFVCFDIIAARSRGRFVYKFCFLFILIFWHVIC